MEILWEPHRDCRHNHSLFWHMEPWLHTHTQCATWQGIIPTLLTETLWESHKDCLSNHRLFSHGLTHRVCCLAGGHSHTADGDPEPVPGRGDLHADGVGSRWGHVAVHGPAGCERQASRFHQRHRLRSCHGSPHLCQVTVHRFTVGVLEPSLIASLMT